ncbi:MAG TPA: GntR family transcriptional regulator [Bacteroidetes bacterium]|nr:GntR family transcriptional regulator [Bacteroidota bacterium]
MIKTGQYNKLRAVRQTDNGVYLVDKEETAEVLLPNKYMPDELYEDDILEVFVYKDNSNRLTATTLRPKATVNQFAWLKCKDVNKFGAFLDWGLDKDLLVPYREQAEPLKEGQHYIVYIYIDGVSGRIVGTTRYLRYLRNKYVEVKDGDEVELLIDNTTELGTNVIINNKYQGMIHASEFFTRLTRGDRCKGYIKHVRHDNKIDVSLHPGAFDRISAGAQKILELIKEKEEGFLPYHDKTPAAVVRKELGMSKKTFKQAIGGLYSRRLIRIEDDGLYLVK